MLDKVGGRRRKLTKDERMAVYKKANGHCAYCGCELEYTGDLSPNQRLTVALLIRWHMWPYAVEKSDNPSKTVSKIKRLLGNDIWNQVMVLNACDRNAH